LEFTSFVLPAGASIIVYNADDPLEAYGPFGAMAVGEQSFWTPTCFSERIVVECAVPPGADLGAVHLVLAQATYRFQGFADAAFEKTAGACNLDVSCYAEWAETALAIGGMGTVTRDGEILCSFALIADNDPCTEADYVLTASHCLSSSAIPAASSAEFYWFYQTDACDGAPPSSPTAVPRTLGGADLIASMVGRALPPFVVDGSDFALLRLRNAPPQGSMKLGWSTAILEHGAEITCIHHPRGDFKRVSFGNTSAQNNPKSAFFWEATWYAGTTQGGSSGSPLLRSDTKEIVGQLWGGLAACLDDTQGNTQPDYYGRFDVSYAVAKAWLDPDPLVVGFASSMLEVSEGESALSVGVELNGPAPTEGLTLEFVQTPGSATPGIDFTVEPGSLYIPAGETEGTILVSIIDDFLREGAEAFGLALLASDCGNIEASGASVHITILDNDRAHAADFDGDDVVSEEELLAVVALFEAGEYHCDALVTGGYAPGPGNRDCHPHTADYSPADWRIDLGEMLRVVQLYNAGGFKNCAEGEDGYCPLSP
jgi:hypothetical protein